MMSQETPGLLKPRPRPFLLSRVLSRLSLSTLEAPPRSQLPGHGPSVAVLSLHFLAFGLPLSSAGSPLCSCGPEDLQPGVLVPGGPTTWKAILPQAWLQLKSLSRPHGFNTPALLCVRPGRLPWRLTSTFQGYFFVSRFKQKLVGKRSMR